MSPPAPTIVVALLVSLLGAPTTRAQSSPPPIDPTLRARFGFHGPLIHKVGDGINLLRVADLDGAGGAEIVLHHGRRGRIEVLSVEGEAVTAESESTKGNLAGLRIADVDGNGTLDLLTVNARGRLEVRLRGQAERSTLEVEVGPAAMGACLRVGDLDGDGLADAIVFTRDGLRTVTNLAGAVAISDPMPLRGNKYRSFELFDIDGDNALDILVATNVDRHAIHLKRGNGNGSFGPWILADVPALYRVFPGTMAAGRRTLGAIAGGHRRVVEFELRHGNAGAGSTLELTTLPERTSPGPRPFAHGDLDGDGDLDLVIADPERAQLTFLLETDGRFERRTAASLAGVSSLALGDLDGDGRTDLALASSEEEALAWNSGANSLDAFPQRLPSSDLPATVAIDQGVLWWLSRDKKRKGKLHRLEWQNGEPTAGGPTIELGRLSSDPLRMAVVDVQDHPGVEIAFVAPGVGLQVVQRDASGELQQPDPDAGAGFTKKMDDGALSLIEHQGAAALMVVRERFARTFRLDGEGQPQILTQHNGPAGADELSLGAVMADGSLLILDRKAGKLYRIAEGQAPQSVDVPGMATTHLLAHHGAALLLGADGVLRVPFSGTWDLHELRTHEPPTEDTNYWSGLAADLDADGTEELALLDEDIHGVHVLVADDNGLRRALSFPVFELPEQLPNVYEPREAATGDVDGDGRTDLVLIAHDRVLIYLQEN